jgi:hypothetical protein
MHLPAFGAIRHDERSKAIVRLVGKHGIKMKATVAVQRKLLKWFILFLKHKQPTIKTILKHKKRSNNRTGSKEVA